jgi:hypothetical protein
VSDAAVVVERGVGQRGFGTTCRFHDNLSTGSKTPEGKVRVVAAIVAGRRRWVEMKAEGCEFPGRRKPGSRLVRGPTNGRRLAPSAVPVHDL